MGVYSDNFNRADGAVGANWTLNDTDRTAPVISSNQLVHSGAASREFLQYVGGASTNNQFSRAKVVTLDDQWLLVRCQDPSTTENAYVMNVWTSGGLQYYAIGQFVASAITWFTADIETTISANDVLELRVYGYTLFFFKNGYLVGSVVDTGEQWASGDPGIGTYGTSTVWDDWEGGDLNIQVAPSIGSVTASGVGPIQGIGVIVPTEVD